MSKPETEVVIPLSEGTRTFRITQDKESTQYCVTLSSFDEVIKEWKPILCFDDEECAMEYLTIFQKKNILCKLASETISELQISEILMDFVA